MRKKSFWTAVAMSMIAFVTTVCAQENPFDMPRAQDAHQQLRAYQAVAIQQQNYKAMEEVARKAVELMPDNAAWHYDLARALALQGEAEQVFEILGKAIDLGFTNAQHMEADENFASVRDKPEFAKLVEHAKNAVSLHDSLASQITTDLLLEVSRANIIYDLDTGLFRSQFKFPDSRPTIPDTWWGPSHDLLKPWIEDGSAAGCYGLVYDNRDNAHSYLRTDWYRGITSVVYGDEAKQRRMNYGSTMVMHDGDAIVLGNASLASGGQHWRSLPRQYMSSPQGIAQLFTQYTNNHIYVYPGHHDYITRDYFGNDMLGDVFPAMSPYLFISMGSSVTDQPILNAMVASLAAMNLEVREYIRKHNRIAPTMQYLLRSTLKTLDSPEEYLTGKAHKPVLADLELNQSAMVMKAHEMTIDMMPPLVYIRPVSADLPTGRPGVDFFDFRGDELVINTPAMCSFVMRGLEQKRTFDFVAEPVPPGVTDTMEYRWVLLQGDPNLVEITPVNPENTAVKISLTHPPVVPFELGPEELAMYDEKRTILDRQYDWQFPDYQRKKKAWDEAQAKKTEGVENDETEETDEEPIPPSLCELPFMTSRVDVGCFVYNGKSWSPPAVISFYYLPNEEREYRSDGKILKMDYEKKSGQYADPVLSLPKKWVDVYEYAADGVMLGWERARGEEKESFTADGFKIETRDEQGRPSTAIVVQYTPNQDGNELIQNDTDNKVVYAYTSSEDKRGTFKKLFLAEDEKPELPEGGLDNITIPSGRVRQNRQ